MTNGPATKAVASHIKVGVGGGREVEVDKVGTRKRTAKSKVMIFH